MIDSKDKLQKILKQEFNSYFPNKYSFIRAFLLRENDYFIWTYQRSLRRLEYHKSVYSNRLSKLYHKLMFAIYSIKVNYKGRKLGIDAWCGIFDEGLVIYHSTGGIVVNSNARIGKNCHLHGNNCIGNNGFSVQSPIIGDNCTIGVGAKIIGNIEIANNIKIGAGAVVTKSFPDENVTLIGIPAHIKNKKF